MNRSELVSAFILVQNTLVSRYDEIEIKGAFAELKKFGLKVIGSPRKQLTGGSVKEARTLLILSFVLSAIFFLFLNLFGTDIYHEPDVKKDTDCLTIIADNMGEYYAKNLGISLDYAREHCTIKNSVGCREIYQPVINACSHHNLSKESARFKAIKFGINGLSAVAGALGITSSFVITQVLNYLKSKSPQKLTKGSPRKGSLRKSPRRLQLTEAETDNITGLFPKGNLLTGGSVPNAPKWVYNELSGGGGDLAKYFPIDPLKNKNLQAKVIVYVILGFLMSVFIRNLIEGKYDDAIAYGSEVAHVGYNAFDTAMRTALSAEIIPIGKRSVDVTPEDTVIFPPRNYDPTQNQSPFENLYPNSRAYDYVTKFASIPVALEKVKGALIVRCRVVLATMLSSYEVQVDPTAFQMFQHSVRLAFQSVVEAGAYNLIGQYTANQILLGGGIFGIAAVGIIGVGYASIKASILLFRLLSTVLYFSLITTPGFVADGTVATVSYIIDKMFQIVQALKDITPEEAAEILAQQEAQREQDEKDSAAALAAGIQDALRKRHPEISDAEHDKMEEENYRRALMK